jgi:hypothetical protein
MPLDAQKAQPVKTAPAFTRPLSLSFSFLSRDHYRGNGEAPAFLIGNSSLRGKDISDTRSDRGGRDIAKPRAGRISKPPGPSGDV